MVLAQVTPSIIFFIRNLRGEVLAHNSFFSSTAPLQKLFDIKFPYKHYNFSHGCLPIKVASKTVIVTDLFALPLWRLLIDETVQNKFILGLTDVR